MIGLCKAAKLRPPEFRQEMGQFIQTLWRPTSAMKGPVGAQSEGPEGTKSALRKYSIDYYQREYRWQNKQVSELIEDLTEHFQDDYEGGHPREEVV